MTHYEPKFIFTAAFFIVLSACRPEPIHETVWISIPPPESSGFISVHKESLGAVTGAFDASHGMIAYQSQEEMIVRSPWFDEEHRLTGELQGVLSVENSPLIFTADGVFFFQEDEFVRSPLSSIWSEVYRNGYADSQGFWALSEDSLYRYSGSDLSRIEVGTGFHEPVAFGATYEGYPSLWFSSEGLHQLVDLPSGVSISHSVDLTPMAIAIDGQSQTWVVDQEGKLFRREAMLAEWHHIPLPEQAINVMANAQAETVWIQMADQQWAYDGTRFLSVETGCSDWLEVDLAGRLFCLSEDELQRQSLYRPVGFAGLPSSDIYQSFSLALSPPFSDQIESFDLRLNGVPQSLSEAPWVVLIQPADWGQGRLSITADILYEDAGRFANQVDRRIDLGIPTWNDDIKPLYELHCSMCHGGSTFTLLDEKERWIDNIDMILQQVQSGDMPQGAPPLHVDLIASIQLWLEGGFQ